MVSITWTWGVKPGFSGNSARRLLPSSLDICRSSCWLTLVSRLPAQRASVDRLAVAGEPAPRTGRKRPFVDTW
ncbi:hypothetical protein Z046_19205 [Pseudomonas aeruginosa VRFPA09]|nr:hypothetical protein Z046_19205 [Pseudomonas aeruginosa VRFPA09]